MILAVFAGAYFLPAESPRLQGAVYESLALARWYAQEHVVLCLVPAFFIAGAIGSLVSQGAVMKYLGPRAKPAVAYAVGSISGALLAVCSCTILPLFGGIWKRGAGLGPAIAFLYAGPAINVLAIILTAKVLGIELGIARATAAVLFSVAIGTAMAFLFRAEERERRDAPSIPTSEPARPLIQTAVPIAATIGVLVFSNLGAPAEAGAAWAGVWSARWWMTGLSALLLGGALTRWFGVRMREVGLIALAILALAVTLPGHPLVAFIAGIAGLAWLMTSGDPDLAEWLSQTWGFTKQILPLLLVGVLLAGFLLGRPDHEGLIPSAWVSAALGGDGIGATLLASAAGAFMYFATLTEVPIIQGLLGAGMGDGPALALLLAGPALSLPNMIVIRSLLGTRKTAAFVGLVVVMATSSGLIFSALFPSGAS